MRIGKRKALGSKTLKRLAQRLASEGFARGSDEKLTMRLTDWKALRKREMSIKMVKMKVSVKSVNRHMKRSIEAFVKRMSKGSASEFG